MVSARQKLRLVAAGTGVTFLPGSYLNLYSGVEGLVCYPLDRSLEGGLEACRGLPKGGENTEKFQGIFAASDRDAWADERFRFFVFYRTGLSLYDK